MPPAGATPETVPPFMASGMKWWNDGIVPVKSWNGQNREAGGFVNSACYASAQLQLVKLVDFNSGK